MKPDITTLRAITVEFASQFIRPFVWTAVGILTGLLLIVCLLTFTVSHWWWLLAIPVFVIGLIGTIIWIIVRFIVNQISPKLNTEQRVATKKFINKLKFVVETAQTPYPIIIFFVIKDIITHKENGIIQEMVTQSKTLRPDYEELKKLF